MTVRMMVGDCRDVLRTLPDESVHCIVTSPPYFGLRDYGVDGQMGLEATPDEFVAGMVAVFRECRRALRNDGTLWLNIGDSYSGGGRGGNPGTSEHQKQATNAGSISVRNVKRSPYKDKDLIGVPWLLAFALRADGWYLRQDIIWAKPNPMPESVTDRCTKSHEYLFLLSKSPRYYFDADAIAEPLAASSIERLSQTTLAKQQGSDRVPGKTNGAMKAVSKYRDSDGMIPDSMRTKIGIASGDAFDATLARSVEKGKRNKRSVWEVATQPFKEAHFATFPPALVEPCILAGCPRITCGNCGGPLVQKSEDSPSVQIVRGACDAGSEEQSPQFLQQDLRVEVDRQESKHDKGIDDNVKGLSNAARSGAPERDALRLRDGASARDGNSNWQAPYEGRGGSPSRREQIEQRSSESRSADERTARPAAQGADGRNHMPALQDINSPFASCPHCHADIAQVGTKPGVVLDCFGGAGTTGLVADRLQRDAILIELNPEYAEIARKRITDETPLFAKVTA